LLANIDFIVRRLTIMYFFRILVERIEIRKKTGLFSPRPGCAALTFETIYRLD